MEALELSKDLSSKFNDLFIGSPENVVKRLEGVLGIPIWIKADWYNIFEIQIKEKFFKVEL